MNSKRLRNIGFFILLMPIAFFAFITLGEVFGGDSSGTVHFFQTIGLILAALFSRKFPKIIGIILTFLGLAMLVIYWRTLITDIWLLLPIIISGLFIYFSAHENSHEQVEAGIENHLFPEKI